MSKQVLRELKDVNPGDLIAVDWCDASTGRSGLNGAVIDVPVRSWGVFLGLIEGRVKHIVIAQNSFKFTNTVFDLDYTAIPISWAAEVLVLAVGHVPKAIAEDMMRSFAQNVGSHRGSTGGLRSPRMFVHRMQRLRIQNG